MEIPSELAQAIAIGDCVLFLGAGLSVGAGLPNWSNLLAPLADEIQLPPARRDDLVKVAQYYENERGRSALIRHIVQQTDTANTKPTSSHDQLLPLALDTWLTTNFDDLLERTLQEAGQRFTKVVRDQNLPFASFDAVTIVKLHGDRLDPDTIVISEADYNNYSQRFPLVRNKLLSLLAEKTFLFLGYSISDPDFKQLQAEVAFYLKEYNREAYAVLFDVDSFVVSDLRRRNIMVIPLTAAAPSDYTSRTEDFLNKLNERVSVARTKSSNRRSVQAAAGALVASLKVFDVCLLHAPEDTKLAETMAGRLVDKHGIKVWLDSWMTIPGSAADRTARLDTDPEPTWAIFVGKDTPIDWFQKKIEEGLERQQRNPAFRIIPVLLPGAPVDAFVQFPGIRTWADFREGQDQEYGFHVLVQGIRGEPIGRWPPPAKEVIDPLSPYRERLMELQTLEGLGLHEPVILELQRKIMTEWYERKR
jgi:hypothetical protein